MKKKLITILLTIVGSILFGYLFFMAWLLGFLASKLVAGKSPGEQGKFRSIIIPFRKFGIHLHHWLYSLFLISFSVATSLYIFSPTVTYGLLGGSIFQGIYSYNDWRLIVVSKHPAESQTASPATEDRR